MHPHDLPPLPPACRPAAVSGLRAGAVFSGQDMVADEVPVALEYNGLSHAVMMASPCDLEDFATGFTLTEGLVQHPGQIYDVEVSANCTAGITIAVQIASGCMVQLKERRRQLSGRTGCGLCGTESLSQVLRPVPPLADSEPLPANAIVQAMQQLRDQQALLAATGATHAAAWCDALGRIHLLREDVGRHNALDKLIGALHRQQHASPDIASGFIAITSRASYEMAHKTAVAGVPVLVAVSGVTALAIGTAQQAGLTLVGFARGQQLSAYSHPQRLILSPA